MEIWIDTCNIEIITKAYSLGIIHGVTTNPSILAGAKEHPKDVISRLLDIQGGPVAVQVTADKAQEMAKEAVDWHHFSERIIVKIPVIQEGLTAIRMLAEESVPIMATAVFQPNQALLAGIAGVEYAAPYLCRMFDEGIDAYESLETMIRIYKSYNFNTKILAAALRTTDQITACARMGLAAVTLKSSLFSEFIADDPATCKALRAFSEDWQHFQYQLLTR